MSGRRGSFQVFTDTQEETDRYWKERGWRRPTLARLAGHDVNTLARLCAGGLSDDERGHGRSIVIKGIQFVTLLLFALVTGVFWGTWFSLSRSMAAITPATFLEVGRLMIANLGGPMSVLMPAALLSALVLWVLLFRRRQTRANLFAAAALVLMAMALTITLVVNVPIDRQIQSWTTSALPPDWRAIRDRWEFYHGLRTLVSLAA
ncbi:MAG: anthrone oxygenase family protein, partial [Acidobacteriota bacterium]